MAAINKTGLNELAEKLNVPPAWIDKQIQFESGWDPLATNPKSGARGLIQFIPSTARGMGFKSADDLVKQYPDTASQLAGPVYRYLKTYAPFPTRQSFHMAIFLPVMRKVFPDTPIPSKYAAPNWPITTPAEYMNLLDGTVTVSQLKKRHPKSNMLVMLLLVLGGALYYMGKRGFV